MIASLITSKIYLTRVFCHSAMLIMLRICSSVCCLMLNLVMLLRFQCLLLQLMVTFQMVNYFLKVLKLLIKVTLLLPLILFRLICRTIGTMFLLAMKILKLKLVKSVPLVKLVLPSTR